MIYKVINRYSKNIPFGDAYIIRASRNKYTAFFSLYGVTFCEECKSLKEATLYLNKYTGGNL